MSNKSHKVSVNAQRTRYVIADWLSGCVAFFVFNIARYLLLNEFQERISNLWAFVFSSKLIIEQCIVPVGMLIIYWLSGYYNRPFGKSRLQEIITTFCSAIINTILIYLILLINDQTGRRIVNYEMIIILFGLLFIMTYLPRVLITSFALHRFRSHNWALRALIIGNSPISRKIAQRLTTGSSRVAYNIIGFVPIPGESVAGDDRPVFETDDIESLAEKKEIDQVILAPEYYDEKRVLSILYRLFHLNIPIKISPDTLSFVTSGIRLNDIYGEPFIDLTAPTLSESSKNVKRSFDVLISGLLLILLSPLYLLLSILVKTGSKGKIIYSQERIGLKQRPFRIYKFRTMVADAEKDGPQLSSDTDSRITRIGRIMRKYRLDELPQFWNVMKGDMSIVGPRPEREFFIRQIVEHAPYYVLVYQVRPGITSWGMIKYGYASDIPQMVERTRYDLIYMANMSLFVDAKILIYTVKTVVTGKGV